MELHVIVKAAFEFDRLYTNKYLRDLFNSNFEIIGKKYILLHEVILDLSVCLSALPSIYAYLFSFEDFHFEDRMIKSQVCENITSHCAADT